MAGRPRVVATAEQREALRALAGSSDREEADRARAILLSLEGWSSVRIAEAFGAVGPGRRSAELDVTAVAGRDRGANRRADLEVAAQRGDA